MPETPFAEKDVLWRWTPTDQQKTEAHLKLDEIVVVKNEQVHGRILPCGRLGTTWVWGYPHLNPFVAAELLRQLRESQARIAVLEEAVTEALAQATGEWDQMQRHPASRFAGDVAYYESVLHPESQAREMLGEDKP